MVEDSLEVSDLWRDVRVGLRLLLRRPGLTLVALVSLVLGIGANTAIFTLLDRVFLHPLAVEDPETLVAFFQSFRNKSGEYEGELAVAYPNYLDYRDRLRSVTELALDQWGYVSFSGGSEPERVVGFYVTANYFDLLGLRPERGRFFRREEGERGGPSQVVVLSDGLWRRLFAADPGVVGRKVDINHHPFTVIGIAPKGFHGTSLQDPADLWITVVTFPQLSPYSAYFERRDVSVFQAIGRLAPGATVETAAAEFDTLSKRLSPTFFKTDDSMGGKAFPLLEVTLPRDDRTRYERYGRAMAMAVALILLIACANVAGLLLVRGFERRREIATRIAVGAARRRIARQLLLESVVLFLVAAPLSLPVARWSMDLLWAFRPPQLGEKAIDLSLDPLALGFAFALALATGLVFGLVPALGASRPDPVASLRAAGVTDGGGRRRLQLRHLLVAVQVALSLVALLAAGIFVESFRQALRVDLGFDAEHLLSITFSPGEMGYDEAQTENLYREVLARVRQVPGVRGATLSENRLLRGGIVQSEIYLDDGESQEFGGRVRHRTNAVSPGFFSTVGIPILEGQGFDDTMREDAPRVAVINQTMAEHLWPGEDPVGKYFHFDYPTDPPVRVVGVAGDAKYRHVREEPQYFVYVPLAQRHVSSVTLHVRVQGRAVSLLPTVRRVVQSVVQDIPLTDVHTMSFFIEGDVWLERMAAMFLSVFGTLSLILAAVGVYGVVAYSVTRRQRELSIRLALGGARRRLLTQVLREAVVVTVAGMVAGFFVFYAVVRPFVFDQLSEVSSGSMSQVASESVVLLAAALLGSLLPASRAARTDPARLLRNE